MRNSLLLRMDGKLVKLFVCACRWPLETPTHHSRFCCQLYTLSYNNNNDDDDDDDGVDDDDNNMIMMMMMMMMMMMIMIIIMI